jgi:predicted metal-dependent peptidase
MATPEIPRPRYVPFDDGSIRTFAVLLDTSGSMDRKLLAKALGAFASYSVAREVDRVRLVFCDAAVYDQGYVPPEDIAGRVRVKGRGGTVLQPGLDLLDKSRDFPQKGPVLIITDGFCDVLRVRRDHAFLVPAGNGLPFVPGGPVFWVS